MGAIERISVVATLLASAIALGCSGSQPAPAQSARADESTVAASATPVELSQGWENLLPPAGLQGFKRVPLDPLADKPVWQVRSDGSLFIDGVGAKEMLLSEREFGDGVLHVEWRFLPL